MIAGLQLAVEQSAVDSFVFPPPGPQHAHPNALQPPQPFWQPCEVQKVWLAPSAGVGAMIE